MPPQSPSRGMWPLRDRPAMVWLALAVIVALGHRFIPSSRWLMVHLVMLGAITHSIMVWSAYFAQALLKTPPNLDDRRVQSYRLWLLLGGSALVLIGVPTGIWPLVLIGGVIVAGAVIWHGIQLIRRIRKALPGRFRVTIRFYVAACTFLPVGITFGILLSHSLPGQWQGRILVAHTMVNLLGWVGLTVTGTLLTLWPTILRARVDERAEKWAQQALPVLIGALLVILAGALTGQRGVVVIGVVGYLLGMAWWARGMLQPVKSRPPRSFATASVGMAVLWLFAAGIATVVRLATSEDWTTVAAHFGPLTAMFVVGAGAQVLLGALSYLLPVVLGGGPAALKAASAWFDKYGALRIAVTNTALILCLLPVPSWVRVACSVLVLIALASFLVLIIGAVVARRRVLAAKESATGQVPARSAADAPAPGKPTSVTKSETGFWGKGQLVAAMTAVLVAVSIGVIADPSAAGLANPAGGDGASAGVSATGETTRVQVSAKDMRFHPSSIEVPAGNRLVIEVTNTDPALTHDLTLAGHTTPRLAPGDSATLDIGVVGESLQGWCTVAGHKQMGMVFDVNVTGGGQNLAQGDSGDNADGQVDANANASADGAEGNANSGHMAGMDGHGDHMAGMDGDGSMDGGDSDVPDIKDVVDPVLPPLTDEKVHRITLRAEDHTLEVAPGVEQKRWTFGPEVPAPTLHGRVGDKFVITLINDASMGHSIDFHAGNLAPDQPMRTIQPGEKLTYTFTAERAGAWLYHCATMPMSSHIAAGMFGAVVIEPPDLPEVDRSYVLVQSEAYVADGAVSEVDADAIAAEKPSYVTFNGIANQYDQQPLKARVGDRVRVWVVDAGPDRATAFHVIGGQFDTVYSEGAYLLYHGKTPSGLSDHGGSQALALAPAQGGFVELTMPEAGHYPFVSHYMIDAERGAHGIIEVTK